VIAFTFSGFVKTLLDETTNPKKTTLSVQVEMQLVSVVVVEEGEP